MTPPPPGLSAALAEDLARARSEATSTHHAELLSGPLSQFATNLETYSQRLSLVSPSDTGRLGTAHLLPALRLANVLATLPNAEVADLGSGAGLPGIPLAMALKRSRLTLIESRRRRANLLRHLLRQLQLSNARVAAQRFEDMAQASQFDAIVMRGVALEQPLLQALVQRTKPHGALLVLLDSRSAVPYPSAVLWAEPPRQPHPRIVAYAPRALAAPVHMSTAHC